MSIEAVIFDIGNVLIEWQPERLYDRVIGEDRRKAMFAEVDLHGMNDNVDRGSNFSEEVAACAARYPHWHDEIMMWESRWIDMASPAIDHSVRLLRALRAKGVPVFALTNFGIQTFEMGVKEYPFLEEFDRRYVSGHMGVIKPDAEIYRMVEEDCGVEPSRLLFADDRVDNINMAKARGWQAHLFTTSQGWADCLVANGLLTASEAE